MEDKEIVQGQLGSKAKYDVAFKGGKLLAMIEADPAAGVVASVQVSLDARAVLDAIKAAIPGQIDDAIINVLEAALLV